MHAVGIQAIDLRSGEFPRRNERKPVFLCDRCLESLARAVVRMPVAVEACVVARGTEHHARCIARQRANLKQDAVVQPGELTNRCMREARASEPHYMRVRRV